MLLLKIITLIASVFACVYIIKYRLQLVQTFGKAYYAEKYLGPGGSYTMWIGIGIFAVILAAFWLFGRPWDNSKAPQSVQTPQHYRTY